MRGDGIKLAVIDALTALLLPRVHVLGSSPRGTQCLERLSLLELKCPNSIKLQVVQAELPFVLEIFDDLLGYLNRFRVLQALLELVASKKCTSFSC